MEKLLSPLTSFLDQILNGITMYRLVLHFLLILCGWALFLSAFNILPYNPIDLFMSGFLIISTCWIVNELCSWWLKIPVNVESVYISGLILTLVMPPIKQISDVPVLFWAAVWTIASKFIFSVFNKHFFNPVAIGILIVSFTLGASANWWVGTRYILPLCLIGLVLITRKIRREKMVLTFFAVSTVTFCVFSLFQGYSILTTVSKMLLDSPWIFFAAIMLTEPLTTPPTLNLQLVYGGLMGLLFAPQFRVGGLFTTPESAILISNVFSYLVSPKRKYLLTLKEKIKLSNDSYDFVFDWDKIGFKPGQYLEWTLPHANPDSRGNRRYFTLASAPTEPARMGVKFYENSSSYKTALLQMNPGQKILAGQLAGDFVLPKNKTTKLVFISGGIGVTPFRSILQHLLLTHEKRDIVHIFSNRDPSEIIYRDIFNNAQSQLGIPTLYVNTATDGRVDDKYIKKFIPDYSQRTFYISGPHTLVAAMQNMLRQLGLTERQIKTDFFPGLV